MTCHKLTLQTVYLEHGLSPVFAIFLYDSPEHLLQMPFQQFLAAMECNSQSLHDHIRFQASKLA